MTYKALLFDLDDTLVDFRQAELLGLSTIHTYHLQSHVTEADLKKTYHKINKKLWGKVETGETTANQVKTERFRLLLENFQLNINYETIAHTYEHTLGRCTNWYPGAEETLYLLKKYYQLGIITNGLADIQQQKYQRLGLDKLFSCYLISEVIGIAKPKKEIFDLALQELNLQPHEALMIGDSLSSDYQGAINAGLDFCWINQNSHPVPKKLPLPKHVLASVTQLPGALNLMP